jgi:hypothetical protein
VLAAGLGTAARCKRYREQDEGTWARPPQHVYRCQPEESGTRVLTNARVGGYQSASRVTATRSTSSTATSATLLARLMIIDLTESNASPSSAATQPIVTMASPGPGQAKSGSPMPPL